MVRDFQLLSIVVPMYNEQEMVRPFFSKLLPILDALNNDFEIICVNDGSCDDTLKVLLELQQKHSKIVIIDLHKNFGKEASLTAGLEYSKGDIVIPIDADLQDPPALIPKLIEEWKNGADEVLAIRSDRSSDSRMKKITSNIFYMLFNKLSPLKIEYHAGDFRLIDRCTVEVLLQLPEKNRFMKGLFSWASNNKTAKVHYTRQVRAKGTQKWSYWKLINFAIDGITSFSSLPLRIWSYIGLLISGGALIFMGYIFFKELFFGGHVAGYASLMCAILFLSGVQLISLGVIGEYIARIFNESKKRPLYIIKKRHGKPPEVLTPNNKN